MNVFLARQPILDEKQHVRAYEIFHRSGFTNYYQAPDPDEASSIVVLDAFQHLGLHSLTAGNPAFINFSSRLLELGVATLFPTQYLVVELLESVEGTKEILDKCWELKRAGYTLALDDFELNKGTEPLLEVAEIVKIDFHKTTLSELMAVLPILKRRRLTLLAEKVESWKS